MSGGLRLSLPAVVLIAAFVLMGCSSGSESNASDAEPTAIVAPTLTPEPPATPTPEPTATPEPTPIPEPTATPAPTSTPVPTATPVPTPTFVVPSEPLFESRGELPATTAQINEMVLFVEASAGRPYLHPPTIVVQSQAEFRAGLANGSIFGTEADALLTSRWLQALGHTDQGLAELRDVLVGDGGTQLVGGYYSQEQDALFMPADVYRPRAFARVLVHELVHALDGQYVDLGIFEALYEEAVETGNYELLNTTAFIVEGRASVVEHAWMWPPAWGLDPTPPPVAATPAPPTAPIPRVLAEEFGARYRLGPVFIREAGGVANTWDLLDNPPSTTEEVLSTGGPDDAVVDVATPAADGPVLQTRVLGALDMALVLNGRGSLTSLARGWAGGAAVMWGDDSSTCVRVAIATDSADDQDRIARTFERWQNAADDRTVALEDELIVATGCAPLIP